MPLQDSFKRKTSKQVEAPPQPRANALNRIPSMEDLNHCLIKAQESIRQPVVLTWKKERKGPAYLLTITRASEAYEPTWILHVDEDNKLTMQWSYTTADAGLIYSLVTEELITATDIPAIIPESLRPGAVTEPAADGSNRSAHEPMEHATAFGDTYQIVSTIGLGGMGVIYKAIHRATGHAVALKVLHTYLLDDPVSVQRFEQEATVARAFDHPNLIRVREFGFSPQGHPFIAMDYLEGIELQALLAQSKRLELPSFINIFTQICEALSYAHLKGLVHRDLKPGNIMLVRGQSGQEMVKIIDFGIAKMIADQSNKRITTSGELLGSPAYMSPEQCGGAVLDARSDIYSLGCVMYEAITGVLPFPNASVVKTIMMQINEQPARFAEARPDLEIAEELEGLIFKALEKDPNERYQTASELHAALWEFAASGIGPAVRSPAARVPTVIEQNTLSSKAYTLLRRSQVLSDEMLSIASSCEKLIDQGRMSIDQASTVIQKVQHGQAAAEALSESGITVDDEQQSS